MLAATENSTTLPVKILVVDDSALMRRALKGLLERHDRWKVCSEAANGPEALEKIQEGPLDLVVLDFQMPGMNGLEVAQEMHRKSPDVPILMVSLHMSHHLADQAKTVGIRGTCNKSDVTCVLEAVDTILHHGTYYRN
jgi:two-component system response regulator DesR